MLSASAGGRVIEVNVREGQEVRQGDILLRLDTERLDNEMARQRRTIQAGEDELAQLAHLEEFGDGSTRWPRPRPRWSWRRTRGGHPGQGAAGRGGAPGRAGAR